VRIGSVSIIFIISLVRAHDVFVHSSLFSFSSVTHTESIRFEEMGPVIINADGTTRRIDNWDQMTRGEQEVAWRRIAKRNEERRKVLLAEHQQEQQKESEEEGKEGSD